MSKYDDYYKNAYADMSYDEDAQIKLELAEGEVVLWKGKPKKATKVYNSIFSAMLPFVMVWLIIDGTMIAGMLASGGMKEMAGFIIPFFALHLMPVWIWLGGIMKAMLKSGYDIYVVTDRRVLIKSGNVLFNSVYYTEVINVAVKRNFADKLAKTGDIYLMIEGVGKECVQDISDYQEVCKLIQDKLMELRKAGHVPTYGSNRGGYMQNGSGFFGTVHNPNGRDRVYQGNYENSHMDAFAEGNQYSNTQYVVNGQFINPPYMDENINNTNGYNNQNY